MSSVIWSLNTAAGVVFGWGNQAGSGTDRTRARVRSGGQILHLESLVGGGKLKELAEEKSIKSRRKQSKINWGKKEKEPKDTEEEECLRGAGAQEQAVSVQSARGRAQGHKEKAGGRLRELLGIRRGGSFSVKQTRQAASGSNSDWRSRTRSGHP